MMKHMLWILALGLVFAGTLRAQSYRSLVDDGNEAYADKKYTQAEEKYKESIREKPGRIEARFNLGNTAYRRADIQAALDAYKGAVAKAKSKKEVAQTLYNVGDAYLHAAENSQQQAQQVQGGNDLRMQGYRQAIEAYKQSLKLDPNDADARYNLVYAMKKLEKMQNQSKDQNKDQKQKQNQKQDKKQDQNQKNKDQKQDQQKKEQQDQQQQQEKQQNEQKPAKPKEQKMSKEQAEQILKALEQDEKNLQKKVRQHQASRVQVDKDW